MIPKILGETIISSKIDEVAEHFGLFEQLARIKVLGINERNMGFALKTLLKDVPGRYFWFETMPGEYDNWKVTEFGFH